jgi:hypothetical protein
MRVPKIYEKVVERMWEESFQGKLSTGKARHILGWRFKLKRQDMMPILKEMQYYKLIKITNSGGRFILILWNPHKNNVVEDRETDTYIKNQRLKDIRK